MNGVQASTQGREAGIQVHVFQVANPLYSQNDPQRALNSSRSNCEAFCLFIYRGQAGGGKEEPPSHQFLNMSSVSKKSSLGTMVQIRVSDHGLTGAQKPSVPVSTFLQVFVAFGGRFPFYTSSLVYKVMRFTQTTKNQEEDKTQLNM